MANLFNQEKAKSNLIVAAIEVARPLQWVKNLALFASLIFSGTLFVPGYFIAICWAFVAFSLTTSATYIFNDLIDARLDRLHPAKRFRPIASKSLPVPIAILEFVFLGLTALLVASQLHTLFVFMILLYFTLQIAYSLFLKNIATVDILIIATGFIIRVYAGAFVIDAHLSVWFLLCVVSVALFLASGKRRAELNVIEDTNTVTRQSLTKYKRELLNSYVTMFGSSAWLSWALFSFFESPKASRPLWMLLAELSKATTIDKLLMVTIPVVIFGIMRYQALIFEEKSEAPEKILLSDKSLIASVTLWTGMIVAIFYGGVSI